VFNNLVEFEKLLPREVDRVMEIIWAEIIYDSSSRERCPFRLLRLFFFLLFVIPWAVGSSTPPGTCDKLVEHLILLVCLKRCRYPN
jgi:hypothetical protein